MSDDKCPKCNGLGKVWFDMSEIECDMCVILTLEECSDLWADEILYVE